ncbi:MAG TPA: glycosyltransferase [Ktedonobacterales bacterium]|nr:glycosyltransferase [Ktedonobacterales bacterium]
MEDHLLSQQHTTTSHLKRTSLKFSPDGTNTDHLAHYAAWLTRDAQRHSLASSQERIARYLDDALRAVIVKGRQIRTFAPFRQQHSAFQTLTPWQGAAAIGLLLAGVLGLITLGMNMVVAVMAVITVFYLGDLLLSFLLAVRTLSQPAEEHIDDTLVHALTEADWPRYTILCPLYKETAILPQFVQSMQAIDYPPDKLQILLLTEENDHQMRQAIEAMRLPAHFTTLTVPAGTPQTKPRACNFGLLHTTGAYVVIYDAEDIPDPLQLKKAVLTFAHHGPDLACVQGKLNFYNPEQNLLTRWFTAEYSSWFDLMLPALQQGRLPLPLGGTSNHFRTEILQALGAWDAFNVTEDCDLGLRLTRYRLRTVVLDSTTYEEANPRLKNWLRQRSRWIKGYMQSYLIHMRRPWRYFHKRRLREFFWLQILLGGKTAVLFINPLMWLLTLAYILAHAVVGGIYRMLFPAPVFYMGVLCLVFGNFFYVYTYLIGCLKRHQHSLVKWALFIPIYWALMSISAFMALYQLIFKPHYWEKTQHGFNLHRPGMPTSQSAEGAGAIGSVALVQASPCQGSEDAPAGCFPPATSKRWRADVGSPGPLVVSTLVSLAFWQALVRKRDTQQRLSRFTGVLFLGLCATLLGLTPLLAFSRRPTRPPFRKRPQQGWSSARASNVTSVTDALKLLDIAAASAQSKTARRSLRHPRQLLARLVHPADPWLAATLVCAGIASLASFWYFFQHHDLLLYGDAYSHMLIARRIFDNATPGLAQLGGVWLPLPHLLIVPFVWNDTLWRTGAAGSIPAMTCYVIATVYLFLSARRLTYNSPASFVGALVFIVNPNILYLQTTPLSELILIATLVSASYYFIAWAQDDQPKQLVWAAAAAFLAALARYDGWLLFVAMFSLIALIGWRKHHPWKRIEGNLLVFGTFGGFAIALWFLWCGVIFGNPLYFQNGPFSSQAQQQALLQAHILYTYHNLWQSARYYVIASAETVGPILFVLGFIGVVVFAFRQRLSPGMLASLTFLVPFAFYVLSLYGGQAALYVPGAVPANAPHAFYNARYGSEAVAPVALFVATLVSYGVTLLPAWRAFMQVAVVIATVAQMIFTASGGIIALQDGQVGLDCTPAHATVAYLAQHYAGGRILEDLYTSKLDALEPEAGINFKDVVYEGSGALWQKALNNPAAIVDWIIANPQDRNDLVARHLALGSAAFLTQFMPVIQESDGITLYHRTGLPPLPTRSLTSTYLADHRLCGTDSAGPKARLLSRPSLLLAETSKQQPIQV